jgi:hypothetical protein
VTPFLLSKNGISEMKLFVMLFGLLFLAVTFKIWANYAGEHPEAATEPASVFAESFAVVELFTSEGCSSCPPADRLLGEMVDEAAKNNLRVFALAFHVDYWDYIGWKDPFADPAFSDRQRNYASALGSGRIYTPQMVVNGQREFVGSNRSKAESSIEWALTRSPRVRLQFSKIESKPEKMIIDYEVDTSPDNAVLNVAVVERDLKSDIRRGENAGRVLHHDNVVRVFKSVKLDEATGEISVAIPKGIDTSKSSIIGYVQNVKTMEILGAAGVEFAQLVNR